MRIFHLGVSRLLKGSEEAMNVCCDDHELDIIIKVCGDGLTSRSCLAFLSFFVYSDLSIELVLDRYT